MSRNLKILHLEDIPTDAELVGIELKRAKILFQKLDVDNKADYIKALDEFEPDIIISDHSLPSFNSREALDILKTSGIKIPFILVTATISEDFAVNIIKEGATDYILKDRMQRLPGAVLNAVEKFKLAAEHEKYVNDIIANEALLRQAEDIALIGSLDLDLITGVRKWSQGMDNILGYRTGEISPSFEAFLNRVHPGDLLRVKKEIDYAIAYKDKIDLEFRVVTPAGKIKHVCSGLIIINDKLGRAVRAKGFIQDVTEKKSAEIKLNEANNEIKKLFNTIDEVFFSRDMANSRLIQISPGCEKMYGYTQEEFLGETNLWAQIIHPDYAHVNSDNLKKYALGDTVTSQYKVFHKTKGIRWAESKVIPTLDDKGTLIRYDGVTRDITEQKNAGLELLHSEQRFRALVEYSSDVIIVTTVDGDYTYVSDNVQKVLGYSIEDLCAAKSRKDFIHPDDEASGIKLFNDTRQYPGKVYSFTHRIKHADGHWVWIEGTLINLLHNPAVNGIVANLRDISKRKQDDEHLYNNHIRLQEVLKTQTAILNALPPHIALLNENSDIIAVNESWKKFAGENDLKMPHFGLGQNYIGVATNAMGDDAVAANKMIAGINNVMAGKINQFSLEYPCDSPDEKRWFQAVVAPLKDKDNKGAVVLHINITDRKLAEQNLLHSEQQYRQIVETAQEGIWIIDENLLTIFVNKKMCDILGYPPEEMIGKHNYDFREKADQDEIIARLRNKNSDAIETYDSVFITKSGKRVTCSVSVNTIFNADGSYLGYLGMLTDITGRKANEEALKKSEANLSAIIENTTDLVYSLDRELKFITFNKVFKNTIKQVYGFEVEQGVSSLEMLETYDAEVAQKWKDIYARALHGEPRHFINEYNFTNNKVYLSYSINPIWEADKVIGLSCFSRDITKQKLDEVALVKSEANLRSVFENTGFSIVLFDNDLKIVSFNTIAANQSMKFFSKKLKIGHSAGEYFPENRRSVVQQYIVKVKNNEPVSYEVIYDQLDGSKEWIEVKWLSVLNQKMENVGVILTLDNITEKKNAALEREKITTDLIRRNKDLEQFTYIISHNLRAPVANIKGLSTVLNYFEIDDAECLETLKALSASVDSLDNVIIDLNQILQTGHQVNESSELVSLPVIIDEIITEISPMIIKNSVVVSCNFDEISELTMLKSYLYSIFQNLIVNSIKYRRSETSPVISIKSEVKNGKAIISFEDNGKGIDLEKYGPQLFGLYKRFDFTVEGKGMGLFMVKMQVENLGGTITVESEPDKGTRFLIELPL